MVSEARLGPFESVRCAMLNGDAAEKLRAYEAATEYQIESEIQKFLERLQRAA